MSVRFEALEGGPIKPSDADVVGPVLHRLKAQSGELTAAAVVEEARSPMSPLHRFFQWNNQRAAELYRIDQAWSLIRSVRIVIEKATEPVREIRLPKPARSDGRKGPMTIVKNVDARVVALKVARKELREWSIKHMQLAKERELAEVFEAIGRALADSSSAPAVANEHRDSSRSASAMF